MRFFFHYNKPASLKAGKPKVSVHINETCFIVDNVVCKVPTTGKVRKRQPYFVMTGRAGQFDVRDNIMYLER